MQRLRLVIVIALMSAVLPQLCWAGGLKFGKLFKMSGQQELDIAADMHEEFAKDPGLIEEGEHYDLVQQVGTRLVERNKLEEYDYQFFVINQDEVNAFATPGGYIYVTVGLLEVMAYDESMLAGVMAHELGHARDRHVAKGYEKMIQGALGLSVLGVVLGRKNEDITDALFAGGQVVYLKYNRDQEEWADRAGVELNYGAGYDAYGLVRGLQCLEVMYGSGGGIAEYMSNHPDTSGRVDRTSRIAKDLTGMENGYRAIPQPPSEDHPLYALYGIGSRATSRQTAPVREGIGEPEKFSR